MSETDEETSVRESGCGDVQKRSMLHVCMRRPQTRTERQMKELLREGTRREMGEKNRHGWSWLAAS